MELKIQIQKLRVFSEKFVRYYTVESMIFTPRVHFQSEAQLCYYLYQKYGTGRYMIKMWKKNQEGFNKYWLGNLMENGFQRDRDKNREVDNLQKELLRAEDYEEREMIEEEIDTEREINREIKKTKKPMCYGLIKSPPGQLNSYETF